jgi:GNAT superfamily N-acetyltransferase
MTFRGKPQVGPGTSTPLTVVPANEASWEDLRAIFGDRGYAASCQCQKYKMRNWEEWRTLQVAGRMERLRADSHCGFPSARSTTGLVAYLDGVPVGWCSVEPRIAYPRLRRTPVPWKDRDENPEDEGVWSVICFATRAGYRRRGVTRALTAAAVDYARDRGAASLEGYPMLVQRGEDVTWGELNVGSRSVFADAGFHEVSHPTLRRVVMRIDFDR